MLGGATEMIVIYLINDISSFAVLPEEIMGCEDQESFKIQTVNKQYV